MHNATRRCFAALLFVMLSCFSLISGLDAGPDTAKAAVTLPPYDSCGPLADNSRSETLPEDSTFSIKFVDVGQADAALVECDGHYMLIDGGNASDSNVIYAILKRLGVEKLDILMASHAHEDHVGGLSGALEYCTADLVLCPTTSYDSTAFENFLKRCTMRGLEITVPEVGDSYELGHATVEILGINAGASGVSAVSASGASGTSNTNSETAEPNDTDPNSSSIICMITYGDTRFLFTGDAEETAEAAVLASGVDLSCDLLKVPHHGSSGSTSKAFLAAADPKYAVISVGANNSYGHPTERVLSLLASTDVEIFRTDLQGDIEVSSDGSELSFSVDVQNVSAEALLTAGAIAAEVPKTVSTEQETNKDSDTADPTESEEPTFTYVLNTNSKKFHYQDCTSVKKMADKNKKIVNATRSEVIEMGYDPCGVCKP